MLYYIYELTKKGGITMLTASEAITKEYLYEEFIVKGRTEEDLNKEVYEKFGFKSISYVLEKHGLRHVKSKYKFSVDESKFNTIDPIFNYYAGLILTDGFIHANHAYVSLCLTNNSAFDIMTSLKNYFKFSGPIRIQNYKNGDPNKKYRYEFRMSSDKLVHVLEKMGAVRGGRKSYEVSTPSRFKFEKSAKMFCRGVLDGDGNIHCSKGEVKGQFRIVKGSENFIQGITNIINKYLGFDYSLKTHKQREILYPKLEMKVKDSLDFYEWVYSCRFEKYRFPEKYDKYLALKNRLEEERCKR